MGHTPDRASEHLLADAGAFPRTVGGEPGTAAVAPVSDGEAEGTPCGFDRDPRIGDDERRINAWIMAQRSREVQADFALHWFLVTCMSRPTSN